MKIPLVFIKCDGTKSVKQCNLTNQDSILEVLQDTEFKYKIEFKEHQGKDYCSGCYNKVVLAEQGLKKCDRCSGRGTITKLRGMWEGYSPGYYEKYETNDYDTYTCSTCQGTGKLTL